MINQPLDIITSIKSEFTSIKFATHEIRSLVNLIASTACILGERNRKQIRDKLCQVEGMFVVHLPLPFFVWTVEKHQ